MKKSLVVFLLMILGVAAGCRNGNGQISPNPNSYSCPPSNGTAYTSIGTTTGALTLSDLNPVPGVQYCYIVQATSPNNPPSLPPLVSLPSNTTGPITVTGTVGSTKVRLDWLAPTSGVPPTGYTASRAVAIQTTILAPTLNNGQLAEVQPALPIVDTAKSTYLAIVEPLKLTAKIK